MQQIRTRNWIETNRTIALLAALAITVAITAACGGGGGGADGTINALWETIATADLNGDGAVDILLTRTDVTLAASEGWVVVVLQDAAAPGTFLSPVNYPTNPANGLAIGDLNLDTWPDIATAHTSRNEISVLLQDSSTLGSFKPHMTFLTDVAPFEPAIGDLDGDGVNDIAVAAKEHITLLFNDPLAAGEVLNRSSINLFSEAMALQNINTDDRLDIALTSSAAPREDVRLALQDPAPATGGLFSTSTVHPVIDGLTDIALADINLDGRMDAAVSADSGPAGTISVLLQDALAPGTTFLPPDIYSAGGGNTRSVAIGDLNSDALPDIAAANAAGHGSVAILFQDSATPGSLLPVIQYDGQGATSDVSIADLNGDSLNDLAVADERGGFILFQDPARPGFFLGPVNILPR